MKIFIVAATHPSINSSTNILIKNILANFEKNSEFKSIWLVYQHEKFEETDEDHSIITPIQNFKNAVEALKKYNPDCVLTNNNKFTDIHYAFSLASNFLKIPLIQYKNADLTYDDLATKPQNFIENFRRNMTQFFSKMPQNSEVNRSSFIIYKKKFLFETNKILGSNYLKNIKSQINDYAYHFVGNTKKRFSDLSDLQLVHNEVWLKTLEEGGVNPSKFALIGNPYWDTLFDTSQKFLDKKNPISTKPIRLLVSTTPLLEHGHWQLEDKQKFLENLVHYLKKESNLSCSFKIHPSTENIGFYKEIFKKLEVDFPIYQKENIWSLAKDFDIVLSYGYSTVHTECALIGFRMILLDTGLDVRQMPLVKSGILSGFIEKCHDVNQISNISKKLCAREISFNDLHKSEIEKIIYKFDGKSGYRAASAILKIVSKKKD